MFTSMQNVPRTPAQLRTRKLFFMALIGAALLIIGPYLDWAKVSNGIQTVTAKGNDVGGIGGWPVVYGLLAVALLFVATRTATLSTRWLAIAAGVLGLWSAIYDLIRIADVRDQISKAQVGYSVKVDGQIGFYAVLLGGLFLAGIAFSMAWLEIRAGRRGPTVGPIPPSGGWPAPLVYPPVYPPAQAPPPVYPPGQVAPPVYPPGQVAPPVYPPPPSVPRAPRDGETLPPAAPTYGGGPR